jgi:hypothetical protein
LTWGFTVDGIKVFLGFIVEAFSLGLQLLKPSLGVNVDGILGVFADVELELELLWRSNKTFAKTFQTHVGRTPQLEGIVCAEA